MVSHFETVDFLEPSENLYKTAVDSLSVHKEKIGSKYKVEMQKFEFEHTYDLIWFQWVVGHLIDSDLISLLKKCSRALKANVIALLHRAASS